MTKTHSHKGSVKALGILVYQCEICAQWFTAIPPLQNHKSQHHSVYDSGMQCKIVSFFKAPRKHLKIAKELILVREKVLSNFTKLSSHIVINRRGSKCLLD